MSTSYLPGGSDGKESACNAKDSGLIPGSGRSPEEGNANPLQYSCLEISWTEEPAGYSPWVHKESDTTERLRTPIEILALEKYPSHQLSFC